MLAVAADASELVFAAEISTLELASELEVAADASVLGDCACAFFLLVRFLTMLV